MTRAAALALLLLASQDPQLERRRDPAAAKLERLRGVRFARPVPVRAGDRREYAANALDNARLLYGEDLSRAELALKSLGLIGSRLSLKLAIPMLAAAGKVQAFYRNGELVFVDPDTPEDELVYKLALALADQRHDFQGSAARLGTSFDAQLALAAVHHGDADMSKQLLWAGRRLSEPHPDGHLASLAAAADKWEREDSKWAGAVVSRIFVRSSDFIWRRGGIFMETIRRREGMEGVEELHRSPPPSTEQILHPALYGRDLPMTIDLKPLEDALAASKSEILYRTTLGELGAAIFLETHLKDDSAAAAAGWGGDTLLHVSAQGGPGWTLWATSWDTPRDAAEFHDLARKAADAIGAESGRRHHVVRRGSDVLVAIQVPAAAPLDAVWKGSVSRKGAARPYGAD